MDRARLVHLLAHLVGERGGDEVAHLGAERFRGRRRQEVHQRAPTSGAVPARREPPVLVRGRVEHERPTLGAAVVELDVVLLHEAVAAVEVETTLGGALRVLGREQQGHRTEIGGVGATGVARPRRLAGEQLRAVERDGDVGQRVLDRLERADRLAELVALGDVRAGEPERAQTQADERGTR